MKYLTILFAAFFLFASTSCNKENSEVPIEEEADMDIEGVITACITDEGYERQKSICQDDVCTQYFDVWKELIQEKNNLSDEYFDEHIEIYKTFLNDWKHGISIHVCYNFQIEWAVAYNCDSFIINIDGENTWFANLNLPREEFLSKDQIALAIEHRAWSSNLTHMTNTDELVSPTLEDALQELIDFSEVNTLCVRDIELDEDSGHLILEATAEYIHEENSCIYSEFDLISGEKETRDGPCFM